MNPKFDGPSFVNPDHTSYGLDNGNNYTTPQVKIESKKHEAFVVKKAEKTKGKPMGGWEDEEVESKPNFVESKYKINSTKENPSKIIKNIVEPVSYSTINYWDAETTKKIQNSTMSVEHETKLIDTIITPTGITIKPSDSQIQDFMKRLKSLNKNIVGKILCDKINSYTNLSDNNKIKILTKCLYVVIAIVNEKVDELYKYFTENKEMFINIQNNCSNKKILELTSDILNSLNGVKMNKKSDLQTLTMKKEKEDTTSTNNSNSDKNSTLSQENKQQKFNFIKKKAKEESIGEIENIIQSEIKTEMMNEIFNTSIENKEVKLPQSNQSKFSFIKNKTAKTASVDSNNNLINLNDELKKVFDVSSISPIPINTNIPVQYTPPINAYTFNKKTPLTEKQHVKDIEMLFSSDFNPVHDSNTQNSQELKQNNQFDFITDLLKPKFK